MITVHRPFNELKKATEAFRNHGSEDKPIYLKLLPSYAKKETEAFERAHNQWRNNISHSTVPGELCQVGQCDELGKLVQPEEMRQMVRISSAVQPHIDRIAKDMEPGFERIIL